MQNLLATYSVTEILIFLVLFALAFKGVVSFIEWLTDWLRAKFKKEAKRDAQKSDIEALEKKVDKMAETVSQLATSVELLIDSDKDDIKSFLTKEHHYFCYQKGWIDDYSLNCCERRFSHYQDEGGNSFIEGFMKELRDLPKQPPMS